MCRLRPSMLVLERKGGTVLPPAPFLNDEALAAADANGYSPRKVRAGAQTSMPRQERAAS
jgi:hypothetical protein